jgi:hypothetical protein
LSPKNKGAEAQVISRILVLALVLQMGLLRTASGQSNSPSPQPDAANLTGLTTPIEVTFSDGRILSGSGFYYFTFGPDDPKATGPQWRSITHIYVVTAKHIIQPKRAKDIVKLTYAVRTADGSKVDWHKMELSSTELRKRLHLCQKDEIDVAVIEVTDDLTAEMKKPLGERSHFLAFNGAGSEEFPGKSPIEVQPGDDVIVIGYPLGFYDQFNKLPVLKTGLLNTPIGLHFNGLDAFLIDFRYYEGSSGSLIITKPTHFGVDNENRIQYSSDRRYVFLGVYEGEWYRNEDKPLKADLGLGWYYYNIEEAIKNPPTAY